MSLNKFTDDGIIKDWMNIGANRVVCNEFTATDITVLNDLTVDDKITCKGLTALENIRTEDITILNDAFIDGKTEMKDELTATKITTGELIVEDDVIVPFVPGLYDASRFQYQLGGGDLSYFSNLRTDLGGLFTLSGCLEYSNFRTQPAPIGTNQSLAIITMDVYDKVMTYPINGKVVGGAVSVSCVSSTQTFPCQAICVKNTVNTLQFDIYVDGTATNSNDPSRFLFLQYFLNIGISPPT